MKKNNIVIAISVVLIVLVIGVGILAIASNKNSNATNNTASMTNTISPNTTNRSTPNTVVETSSVTIQNFKFSPSMIKVKKGTTVTWTNQDDAHHTVTGDKGAPDSKLLAKGESTTYTFNQTGTFPYHCDPHPYMQAIVVVE